MALLKRVNKKLVFFLIGLIVCLLGLTCLVPFLVSYFMGEGNIAVPFLLTLCLCAIGGVSLIYFNRDYHLPISKKDGQIIIGILWLLTPLLGAMPYMFFPDIFTITDAIFESYSGFTTTGSTIITDLSIVPKGILVYRAMTQWVGGLGFAVVIILVLRSKAGMMMNIFNAEFSSIYKNKMYPHLFDTALRIILIYISLTILAFILFSRGSMDYFQAFCHALSSVATGGFSTENANIGAFTDAYTQSMVALIMFLSGTSYFVFIRLFKGEWKVLKDNQFLAYLGLIFLCSLSLVIYWLVFTSKPLVQDIREALFYTISIITTTGFDLETAKMGLVVSSALVFFMFIGGCSASSASGLKIIRVVTLGKFTMATLKKIFHPHAIIPVKFNGISVDEDDLKNTFGFFFLYMFIFIIGVILLCWLGNPFSNSLALSIANLGNVGPVVGGYMQGFSYASLNIPSQFVLLILMIIGRLEIFAFLALFSKSVWRKV